MTRRSNFSPRRRRRRRQRRRLRGNCGIHSFLRLPLTALSAAFVLARRGKRLRRRRRRWRGCFMLRSWLRLLSLLTRYPTLALTRQFEDVSGSSHDSFNIAKVLSPANYEIFQQMKCCPIRMSIVVFLFWLPRVHFYVYVHTVLTCQWCFATSLNTQFGCHINDIRKKRKMNAIFFFLPQWTSKKMQVAVAQGAFKMSQKKIITFSFI